MQENFVPILLLCWLTETKIWNLGLTLHTLHLNKTINLPSCQLSRLLPCHLWSQLSYLTNQLTILPPFQLTTLPPFQPLQLITLPHLPPSQFTTLQTTNRLFQNSNVVPLVRQGKHEWLIARQLPMKPGWWDPLLAPPDLAQTISMALIMGGSPFWLYGSPLSITFLSWLPTPDSAFQVGSSPTDFHTSTANNHHSATTVHQQTNKNQFHCPKNVASTRQVPSTGFIPQASPFFLIIH